MTDKILPQENNLQNELLSVTNLSVYAGKNGCKKILDNIDFNLYANELLVINGPNGAGKSTLVRACLNAVSFTGSVKLFNKDITTYKNSERAKHIAMLSQIQNRDFGYTVEEVVRFGLYNRRKSFLDSGVSVQDNESVLKNIELTGISELIKRSITTLSGGELQRVYLAQAFTQNPDILILDEPTNNLDIGFQFTVFEIIKEWLKQENKAVIAIVHDINLCRNYADKVLMLHKGQIAGLGTPQDVFTFETLSKIYNPKTAEFFTKAFK